RHEAGHVLQVAFQLHRRRRWRELFGPSSRRYPRYYRPNPASRRYVNHLPLWYAQSHPDEDFAETFAAWLTPRSNWRRRYARGQALGGGAGVKEAEICRGADGGDGGAEAAGDAPAARRAAEPAQGDAGRTLCKETGASCDRLSADLRPRSAPHLLRRSEAPSLSGGVRVSAPQPRQDQADRF